MSEEESSQSPPPPYRAALLLSSMTVRAMCLKSCLQHPAVVQTDLQHE